MKEAEIKSMTTLLQHKSGVYLEEKWEGEKKLKAVHM